MMPYRTPQQTAADNRELKAAVMAAGLALADWRTTNPDDLIALVNYYAQGSERRALLALCVIKASAQPSPAAAQPGGANV